MAAGHTTGFEKHGRKIQNADLLIGHGILVTAPMWRYATVAVDTNTKACVDGSLKSLEMIIRQS
jgi:hypothetical protein